MRMRYGRLAIAVTLLMSPIGVLAEPRELPRPTEAWISPSAPAVTFPRTIGTYERARIVEYGDNDWSVAYARSDANGETASVITVYFYRWPGGCAGNFEHAIASVNENNPSARELARELGLSPRGGSTIAQIARFGLIGKIGTKEQPLTSQVYVYCHPKSPWSIKARSTWVDGVNGKAETYALLQTIGWPAKLAD